MSKEDLFLTQLRALHHQLLGAANTIQAILELADAPTDDEQQCEHPIPLRLPVPAMGHPGRFKCRGCDEVVEG